MAKLTRTAQLTENRSRPLSAETLEFRHLLHCFKDRHTVSCKMFPHRMSEGRVNLGFD
jgi:hypothetical protein